MSNDPTREINRAISIIKDSMRKQGPCAFCGAKYAAHRQIDVEMHRVAAGEFVQSVVDDYEHTDAAAMVMRWVAFKEIDHE